MKYSSIKILLLASYCMAQCFTIQAQTSKSGQSDREGMRGATGSPDKGNSNLGGGAIINTGGTGGPNHTGTTGWTGCTAPSGPTGPTGHSGPTGPSGPLNTTGPSGKQ